jgi:hypothetical protein
MTPVLAWPAGISRPACQLLAAVNGNAYGSETNAQVDNLRHENRSPEVTHLAKRLRHRMLHSPSGHHPANLAMPYDQLSARRNIEPTRQSHRCASLTPHPVH